MRSRVTTLEALAAGNEADQRHQMIVHALRLRRSQRLSAIPLARSIRMAEPVAVRPPDPAAMQVQAEACPAEKQQAAAASAIDATIRLIRILLCSELPNRRHDRVKVPTSLLRGKAVGVEHSVASSAWASSVGRSRRSRSARSTPPRRAPEGYNSAPGKSASRAVGRLAAERTWNASLLAIVDAGRTTPCRPSRDARNACRRQRATHPGVGSGNKA